MKQAHQSNKNGHFKGVTHTNANANALLSPYRICGLLSTHRTIHGSGRDLKDIVSVTAFIIAKWKKKAFLRSFCHTSHSLVASSAHFKMISIQYLFFMLSRFPAISHKLIGWIWYLWFHRGNYWYFPDM